MNGRMKEKRLEKVDGGNGSFLGVHREYFRRRIVLRSALIRRRCSLQSWRWLHFPNQSRELAETGGDLEGGMGGSRGRGKGEGELSRSGEPRRREWAEIREWSD